MKVILRNSKGQDITVEVLPETVETTELTSVIIYGSKCFCFASARIEDGELIMRYNQEHITFFKEDIVIEEKVDE